MADTPINCERRPGAAEQQLDVPSESWLERRDDEHLHQQAYFELFDIDACMFRCILCGRSDLPCPEHAPVSFPGLRLAECYRPEADHPRLFVYDADDYGVPCYLCLYEQQRERVDELTRCRHWPWRRWRITGKALGRLPLAFTWSWNDPDHRGCYHSFRWWWGKWKWRGWHCLLRRRPHWPSELIGCGDVCGKCAPCPDCGSTTAGHEPNCPTGWGAHA